MPMSKHSLKTEPQVTTYACLTACLGNDRIRQSTRRRNQACNQRLDCLQGETYVTCPHGVGPCCCTYRVLDIVQMGEMCLVHCEFLYAATWTLLPNYRINVSTWSPRAIASKGLWVRDTNAELTFKHPGTVLCELKTGLWCWQYNLFQNFPLLDPLLFVIFPLTLIFCLSW